MNLLFDSLHLIILIMIIIFVAGMIRGAFRVLSGKDQYLTDSQKKGLEILRRRALEKELNSKEDNI